MKQSIRLQDEATWFLVCIFLVFSLAASSQEKQEASSPLPDNINKIVSVSCMPCHSSTGGTLSKAKLNFTEWTSYSEDKQKKKAEQMYKQVKKNAMPPKSAREANPGIIPTSDQLDMIKAWVDSLENESK
jgi:uncharacterized membrane protein